MAGDRRRDAGSTRAGYMAPPFVRCDRCGETFDASDPDNILKHWHHELRAPVRSPRELAERMAQRSRDKRFDPYIRETFRLPRLEARQKAEDFYRQWPKEGYDTMVESWAEEPGDIITFTMRRSKTAD